MCVCVCVCVFAYVYIIFYTLIRILWLITSSLAQWVEYSPTIRETWVQSQVASYQRLWKWYLIPACLTLSNIRYVLRVKWSNPGKGVAPSATPWCSSYWKGSLLVALDYGRQLYLHIHCEVFLSTSDSIVHWSLSDRKSPQVSRTLLSILANLNNAVVWIVSILPLIFNSSSSLFKPLGMVPSAPTTNGIILMFHSFLISLTRPKYLFFISIVFISI